MNKQVTYFMNKKNHLEKRGFSKKILELILSK